MTSSQIVADLHLHSPYSRAVSKHMTIPEMSWQAKQRGIDLLATGDWTHPAWFQQLETELEEWQPGIYASRQQPKGAKFLLSTEISCIFSQDGQLRRVHLLIMAPSLKVVADINQALAKRGVKLASDGRPVMGLSCQAVTELVLTIDPTVMVIPAHAWTPWFGVLGSRGGFESLTEAFGELVSEIYAIETGLSSDPLMNWRIAELDNRAIVSFSDAHSPAKMGRELTVFAAQSPEYSFADIRQAITARKLGAQPGKLRLDLTVEFYPEEGKYHWDGHRACGVVQSPAQTRRLGTTCPVCGKPLTVGVEFRVEELATRPAEDLLTTTQLPSGIVSKTNAQDPSRPPYVSLVPLQEIVAEVRGKGVGSQGVVKEYRRLLQELGSELAILMEISIPELEAVAGYPLAQAIMAVRQGKLEVKPGYDGVYGVVTIPTSVGMEQGSLFG